MAIPVITSSASEAVPVSTFFSFPVTADNTPTSFAAVGLSGTGTLAIDTTTGVISGVTPAVAGVFDFQITATNGSGTSAIQTFTLTVNALAITVVPQLGTPPDGLCFGTPTEFFALIRAYLAMVVSGPLEGLIVSPTAPSVDELDKLWVQTGPGVNGVPLRMRKFYNGFWRPIWGANIGDIRFVTLAYPLSSTLFDTSTTNTPSTFGLGLPGQDWDGWAIANGNNSTIDLREKFPMCGSDLAGQISPGETGGAKTVTIFTENMPPLTLTYDKTHIERGNTWTGGSHTFGPQTPAGNASDPYYDLATIDIGGNQTPLDKLPLYYALNAVQFVGYS